ncbi:MAG: hypothetical protein K2X41_04310 [Hyphomicrobium sp.]|nr:hypothetical protein [Hyphomicrobium sp.]
MAPIRDNPDRVCDRAARTKRKQLQINVISGFFSRGRSTDYHRLQRILSSAARKHGTTKQPAHLSAGADGAFPKFRNSGSRDALEAKAFVRALSELLHQTNARGSS